MLNKLLLRRKINNLIMKLYEEWQVLREKIKKYKENRRENPPKFEAGQEFYVPPVSNLQCTSINELFDFYKELVPEENAQKYQKLLSVFHGQIGRWTASSKENTHHYGYGGLKQHTREVISLAITNARWHNETHPENPIDLRDMFFAALYHDIGKIKDYELVGDKWKTTKHKKTHHHIFRSALIWYDNARGAGYPEENMEAVGHAILAHHNLPEWGSAVSPQTPLALILHTSDYISAHTDYMCKNE